MIVNLKISRAKALVRLPASKAAWEAAVGKTDFKKTQNKLNDISLGL
jgi:hypothetical protein